MSIIEPCRQREPPPGDPQIGNAHKTLTARREVTNIEQSGWLAAGKESKMLTHITGKLFPSGKTDEPSHATDTATAAVPAPAASAIPQEDCTACRAIGTITFLCISAAAFSEAWNLHGKIEGSVGEKGPSSLSSSSSSATSMPSQPATPPPSQPRRPINANALWQMFSNTTGSAGGQGHRQLPSNPRARVAFLTAAGVAFGGAGIWRWFIFKPRQPATATTTA